MTSKQIGNIGESRAIYEFVKRNIPVYIPFGDNESADLIADFKGKLNKIQVKTSLSPKIEGAYEFTTARRPTGKGERIKYSSNEVDYFVFYAKEIDNIFLVPYSEIENKASFTIRYKNGNNKSHLAKNYSFDKVINE